MRKYLFILVVLAAYLGAGAKAHADSNVYRLYNANTGEHFYTTSLSEANVDISAGWQNEGVGWVAPTTSKVAIYRVYNPNAKGGDHYYTQSLYEARFLVKNGWKWDNAGKPVFYSGGNDSVYVAYNPNAKSGAHNYTPNLTEENNLIHLGWKYKTVAWNAVRITPIPVKMDAQQVAKGDLLTLQGIWKNSIGDSVTFKGNTVIETYVDATGKVHTDTNNLASSGTEIFGRSQNGCGSVEFKQFSLGTTLFDDTMIAFAQADSSPKMAQGEVDKTNQAADRFAFIRIADYSAAFSSNDSFFYRVSQL